MPKIEPDLEGAQTLALEALAYLAANPEIFMRFMSATGLDSDAVAAGADNTEIQAAVLDYLMRGESDLIAFCAESGKSPKEVFWALHALDPHAMSEMPQGLINKPRPAVWRR